ncbi:SusC/RagA family TonB-linked outer membrane protein [Hymenobacter metallicola]|uniref:TonB-dependent receptor n=1 Tax=Hymenobacter metallicola TaxID=2563114 RepID=A0A4Z0Q1P1_9BACT|nr:TonB-dependent receptor [Hymenobacter metallicola]TGE23436.1 TonB-dependent receptor [Hymenobacter metallicola]
MRKYILFVWLLLSVALHAVAQQRSIQGVVRSTEKDEPLPGVTVVVKGTTIGASTDMDGKFAISLPANTANVVLRLSYIGFLAKDVTVGNDDNLSIKLSPDTKVMEDVVVIGYAEVPRKDVTGSVASVGAKQIKDVPVNSAAEALTGRLAGVQVTSSEGQPGSDIRIRVRGGGSITQDNSPLYIVDGVQLENALSVLSPQDIASVDVLKDASATAIYGARGANGVVIITTKGGREGKLNVNYTGFAGVRKITRTLDVMKPAEYTDYAYEKAALAGSAGLSTIKSRFGSTNFRDTRDYSQVEGYDTLGRARSAEFIDWQDRVFGRDAFQQTHNVTLSGGGKGSTFSLSLTRNQEDGIQILSGFTRNLVNFRFDHKASDKFKFGLSTRFNDQTVTGSGTSNQGSGSTTNTRLRNTIVYQPLALQRPGAIDPNENLEDDEFFRTSGSLSNPVLTIENEYRADKRRLFNLGGNAQYNFTKSLAFRSTVGFDNSNTRTETFNGQFSPTIKGGNFSGLPFLGIATGSLVTFNNSNVLTYNFNKDKHAFDALLGHEIYMQEFNTQNVQSYYLPLTISSDKAFNNINQRDPNAPATPQPAPTTDQPVKARLLSGFARLNYSFDDKYLLTATFRGDGSSKFARGLSSRWGFFPAASAAWRISQEEFMKPLAATVSDLKLRVSYGLAGNNRIADNLYRAAFRTSGQYALNESLVPGAVVGALANENLKWETTISRNLGLDISLFSNRVQLTIDAYANRTRDLLLNLAISPVSGYTSQLVNIGATSNRGLEFQATGTVIQTPDFTWTANANLAFNRNRIESLGTLTELPLQYSGWASTAITADYYVAVGQPVGLMYGYVTDGFYTADDFEGYSNGKWNLKPGVVSDRGVVGYSAAGEEVIPGTIKLKDLNGDGVVTDADRTVIGNANPKFTGGLNQQFAYKGFDASIFLNWVFGNDIYNANKIELTSNLANSYLSNGLAIMNDRYRTIDENGVVITDLETSRRLNQNAKIWTPTRQLFPHSWAIEDGSFLRVNNLTLGYTLPKTLTSRAKLTQLRFYVTANNLYTFTKYTGFDPEVNTRRGTPLTPGVDYAAYPRSKAFLFGINLSL